ncbi:MAG: glycosyltransferase [Pseudomonadota bacterium]
MVDIVGYIRFSHPARSDVRIHRQQEGPALLKAIWDPQTLDVRFACFEQFTLPSIQSQTDKDFRICVAASPRMPGAYLDRLRACTAHIPQIDLFIEDAEPDQKVHDLFDAWFAGQSPKAPGSTLHFRLDDDDALSQHMIAHMRKSAAHMQVGEVFSAPNGILAGCLDGAPSITPHSQFFLGIGLGFLRDNADPEVSPYRGPPHVHLSWHVPARLSPLYPAWIRTTHRASDTQPMNDKRLRAAERVGAKLPKRHNTAKRIEKSFPFLTYDTLAAAMIELS